jgi:hypothetical protein
MADPNFPIGSTPLMPAPDSSPAQQDYQTQFGGYEQTQRMPNRYTWGGIDAPGYSRIPNGNTLNAYRNNWQKVLPLPIDKNGAYTALQNHLNNALSAANIKYGAPLPQTLAAPRPYSMDPQATYRAYPDQTTYGTRNYPIGYPDGVTRPALEYKPEIPASSFMNDVRTGTGDSFGGNIV